MMPKPISKQIVVKVYQGETAMSMSDAQELIGWELWERGGL